MLDNLKDEYWHYSVSRQSQSIILACTGEFSLVWPHPVRQGYTPLLQNRVWHASVVSRAKFIQCLEWCISVSKVAGRVKLFWYITSSLVVWSNIDHTHLLIAKIWLPHRSTSGSKKIKALPHTCYCLQGKEANKQWYRNWKSCYPKSGWGHIRTGIFK